MNPFPGSPRLLKGGLVLLDPVSGSMRSIIPLQYNPESLTRSLQIKGYGGETGDRVEALRLTGPPVETLKLEVEIDATDMLEASEAEDGLHRILAQLEVLVYPTSAQIQANDSEAGSGSLEIVATEAPLTVFVFGAKRIVPVRLTEFSVTEEAFDQNLNPIRARVSLAMRVLTVDDVPLSQKGGGLFLAYLQSKERLAQKAKAGTFGMLGITGVP